MNGSNQPRPESKPSSKSDTPATGPSATNSSAGSGQPNSGAREGGTKPNTGPITAEQALAIARATVKELAVNHNYVLDERPIERLFGWVFYYTTREYLETGDRKYLVPGTAPFVVHRQDGSVMHLPTSMLPEQAIEIYEAQWQEAQRQPK